ncbi:hypothetical protein VK66_02025 [Stenotrophomonas maltophilia]|nr:hypothetical protein VK66_02025 [Stenotrophomonas maltophilia]
MAMTIQKCSYIQFSMLTDRRCAGSIGARLSFSIVLIDASGQFIVEMVSECMGMDQLKVPVHSSHSAEDLAIKSRNGEWLPPASALPMRDQKIRMLSSRRDRRTHLQHVSAELLGELIRQRKRSFFGLSDGLMTPRIKLVVLGTPNPNKRLVTQVKLVQSET